MEFNVKTIEAIGLKMKVLDYLILCDDPKYNNIVSIRQRISKVVDNNDREELIKFFNNEFNINGYSDNKNITAWDYYQNKE